jgi:hypothetical protein
MKSWASCSPRISYSARSFSRQPNSWSNAATRSKNGHLLGGQAARLLLSCATNERRAAMIRGSSACRCWRERALIKPTAACQSARPSALKAPCRASSASCDDCVGGVEISAGGCAAGAAGGGGCAAGAADGDVGRVGGSCSSGTARRDGGSTATSGDTSTMLASISLVRGASGRAPEASCSARSRASTSRWNPSASSSGRMSLSRRA